MAVKTSNAEHKPARIRAVDVLIAIALLGSIWGFVEVVVGGAIKAGGLPHRTAVVTALGFATMGIALGVFRRPLMLPLMAVVAVCVKQLVVPILHLPFFCDANSLLAVGIDGVAVAGIFTLARGSADKKVGPPGTGITGWLLLGAVGASSALLASGAFHTLGMKVAPCQHLLSYNRSLGLLEYMAFRGSIWAAFSAVLFPVGYLSGLRIKDSVLDLGVRRPGVYYATSIASVVACWIVSAIAISAGL
jgi:hypothetical protein